MVIFVIGAGASGYFSAIHNKEKHPNSDVILVEKSVTGLAKVKVSGGGRCNVTHACFDEKELVKHYPRGEKALLGPFYSFQPRDTVQWFESRGVALKTEADGRMFPVSDSSQSIIDCLQRTAKQLGVKLWTKASVTNIKKTSAGFELSFSNGDTHHAEKLILATGSSKVGYDWAKQLGHRISAPVPSLFTLSVADKRLHDLSGLSVKRAKVWLTKKRVQEGPLLITHWGFSGPAIIKLSAWHARDLFDLQYQSPVYIQFLADYSLDDILRLLKRLKETQAKKSLAKAAPFKELPNRLWCYLLAKAGLNETKSCSELGPKQLNRLAETLHISRFEMNGKSTFKEEFVTCGGVCLDEINFKTMESKVCPGLHIVGELLDIDGVTGGFNFQNAWTTAYLSAQ